MMFTHCYNNYIKYGWGSQLFGHRQRDEDKYWINFGKCVREPMDFRSECINTAELIYESTEKKIVVHYSGGLDSEIVCQSFLAGNVPFEVVTWVFTDGIQEINKYDIRYAIDFCKKYNIKQTFIEIDIVDFIFKKQFELYISKYFVPIWHSNLVMYMADRCSGYQVLGESEVHFVHDPMNQTHIPQVPFTIKCYPPPYLSKDTYKLDPEYSSYVLSNVHDMGKEVCREFFSYTPEQILAYINTEYIQDWLEYCKFDKLPTNRLYPQVKDNTLTFVSAKEFEYKWPNRFSLAVKGFIRYKAFPECKVRPKYHGVESILSNLKSFMSQYEDEHHYNSPGNEIYAVKADKFIEDIQWK